MAEFKRGMGPLIAELKKEDLFQNKLKKDIEEGNVFFAIRNGYGSFYVKGSSLFSYRKNNGFSTHYKFGFIPDGINDDAPYICESQLDGDDPLRAVKRFCLGYDRIKRNAELYAKTEAEGVSALYAFAPRTANRENRFFLVDIEVAFNSEKDTENQNEEDKGEKKGSDRIDILLYDNHEKQLLFCEAKHFSNPEIWAKKGSNPKVINQLEQYDRQIVDNKDIIIKEYTTAFSEYNALMGTELNAPKSVFDKCGLYIFGFNLEERKELKRIFDVNKNFYGRKCRIIGGSLNDSIEKIYTALV